jgi:hypothetical protein
MLATNNTTTNHDYNVAREGNVVVQWGKGRHHRDRRQGSGRIVETKKYNNQP